MKMTNKEIKSLSMFLTLLVASAFVIWLFIGLTTPRLSKESSKIKTKADVKVSRKNLVSRNDEDIEKVPLVDENFEVYQFKDPFMPLSEASAPTENLPRKSSNTSSNTASVNSGDLIKDSGNGDTINGTNTALLNKDKVKILDIKQRQQEISATIIINGKKEEVVKGQDIDGRKIIDIDKDAQSVEILRGDQKYKYFK